MARDSGARKGMDLLELLSNSPTCELDVETVSTSLGCSRNELSMLVDTLSGISDSVTGARIAIALEGDKVRLLGDAGALKPIRLTNEEAVSLACVLNAMDVHPDVRARAERALLPLGMSLADTSGLDDATEYGDSYPQLAEAIRYGIRCEMLYRSSGDERPTWRLIDPISLETVAGRAYLTAWDIKNAGQRRYRLDRVDEIRFTDDSVEHHPWRCESIERSLRLHGKTARLAFPNERYARQLGWAGLGRVSPIPGTAGRVQADVRYTSETWLLDHVLGGGGDIVILAPADLRARLIAYARGLL